MIIYNIYLLITNRRKYNTHITIIQKKILGTRSIYQISLNRSFLC